MLFCVVCSKVCEGYAGGGAEIAHMQSKLMEHIGNEPPDEEYCNQLQLKSFLHSYIHRLMGKSTTPYAQIPTLTPDEFLDHALYVPNPLLSALCSLWTGYWLLRNGS